MQLDEIKQRLHLQNLSEGARIDKFANNKVVA